MLRAQLMFISYACADPNATPIHDCVLAGSLGTLLNGYSNCISNDVYYIGEWKGEYGGNDDNQSQTKTANIRIARTSLNHRNLTSSRSVERFAA